jgi:hypothetical protein
MLLGLQMSADWYAKTLQASSAHAGSASIGTTQGNWWALAIMLGS